MSLESDYKYKVTDVINNSLSGGGYQDSIHGAYVDYANAKGAMSNRQSSLGPASRGNSGASA